MYRFYMVPDATPLANHSDIYTGDNLKLFWDPKAESDIYAVLEPQLKEELNKAASLEFTVLPSNICYNDFHKRKTVVVVFDESTWLFEGVVTDCPVDFFKRRKVTVTSPLSYLCDSLQAPDEKNTYEVPKVGSADEERYLPVPNAWYAGANPKSLNWYEQEIVNVYEPVLSTDVFISGTAYYTKSGNNYTRNTTINASNWANRPQLYTEIGQEVTYSVTKDTRSDVEKAYYYAYSGDGKSYSGSSSIVKAATKETIANHITRLLNVHNAQVDPFKRISIGTLNDEDTAVHEFKSSNYRTTWESLKSDILDEYGKYFTITRNSSNNLVLNYKSITELPTHTGALIEFANNMLEMNEADSKDTEIFTVLLPIGKKNVTVEKVTGHDSPEDSSKEISPYIASFGGQKKYVVVSEKAVAKYGHIFKPISFSDVGNGTDLYDRAVKYIKNNYDYHVEYDVKAIDLRFINGSGNRIRLGDRIRLHSKWHGVDVSELHIVSAEHDLENPENDSYKVGIPTADREARNRTLTGQSSQARSKSEGGIASAQSAIDAFSAKLSSLMEITEWGIKAHTRIENTMESNDGMYLTRFQQTETDINIIAQKIFGDSDEGDAGYIQVPTSEYKDSKGSYKDPTKEHWFERSVTVVTIDNKPVEKIKYALSKKTTCDPAVNPNAAFYVQRLATRYSDIDVGPGGIKERVDGNYERSIASSTWISMNENALMALTGHLFVDEDGHVHVSVGGGMRTEGEETKTEELFRPVSTLMMRDYTGAYVSPKDRGWYKQKIKNGKWTGEGKEDKESNPSYYVLCDQDGDDVIQRDIKYYYKSHVQQKYKAEYGVYDEDNLTAGMIAQVINNPSYKRVSREDVDNAIHDNIKLGSLQWYIRDDATGLYGAPLPDESDKLPSVAEYKSGRGYYKATSQAETRTAIFGDHIVIGGKKDENGDPIIYDGVDDATRSKIEQYISDHNLDGTITEIASDVVVVRALFADYIETDEIVVGTHLYSDFGTFNSIEILGRQGEEESAITAPSAEIAVIDGSLNAGFIRFPANGNVTFGSNPGTVDDLSNIIPPGDIIVGFGTPTISGDNVSIPYLQARDYISGNSGEISYSGNITFTKPASLGTVTWSSGEKLTVKTAGGKTFFHANLDIQGHYMGESTVEYQRKGKNFEDLNYSLLKETPTLRTILQITGTWTGESHDESEDNPHITEWEKAIFFDASKPYNDGYGVGYYDNSYKNTSNGPWGYSNNNETIIIKNKKSETYFSASLNVQKIYASNISYFSDGKEDNKDISTLLKNKPILKAVLQVSGTWTGESHDESEDNPHLTSWEKPFYIDATQAYNDGHTDGWDDAASEMEWPSTMQALGERDNFTIKYPSSGGNTNSTTFKLLDADTKGSTAGYIRVYRDYIDDSNRGNLIGAIDVSDWYTSGYNKGSSNVRFANNKPQEFQPANYEEGQVWDRYHDDLDYRLKKYHTVYYVQRAINGNPIGSRMYFTTPVDSYDDGARTLTITPNEDATLGYGAQVTVTASTSLRSGTFDKSVVIKAPIRATISTYYDRFEDKDSDVVIEAGSLSANKSLSLGYSEKVEVKARAEDAGGTRHGKILTITTPGIGTAYTQYYYDDGDGIKWHDLTNSGGKTITLPYDGTVTVRAHHNDSKNVDHYGKQLIIKAPAAQGTSAPDGNNILVGSISFKSQTNPPTDHNYHNLSTFDDIISMLRSSSTAGWIVFKVTYTDDNNRTGEKWYKIDATAT